MKFDPLVHGKLVKRYKRFLADIELDNGNIVTAHCPNSGSLKSCIEEGADVYCSPVKDPSRKTRLTWEMIKIGDGWVGVNTGNPNKMVFEWIRTGIIPGFENYTDFRREVKWEDSRFDVCCSNETEVCFVEVKNVTLKVGDQARFPDAVTTRGRKHLETLIRVVEQGMRAVMVYCVQRADVQSFEPAADIDPDYATSLAKAKRSGVEIIIVQAKVTPEAISFMKLLPMGVE